MRLPTFHRSQQTEFPPPGLYHFLREDHGERVRIHLRLDPDGHGTLIINANQILHLNPTAAWMACLILNQVERKAALRALLRRFRVPRRRLHADFDHFHSTLEALLQPDACPLCTLPEAEVIAPFSHRPLAPYRMDLALTYRCNDDCAHCYNARPRDFPEMPTETWKAILDRLWELGIPHVVFTGGEPTLRDDLPELIAHAEANGQITGLNTNARRLSEARFLDRLVEAGLDHIQITVESHDPEIHDRMVGRRGAWRQTIAGLKNALATPLYVMTNTTMLQDNHTTLGETLDFLADLGVPTIGLNALIYAGHGRTVGTGLPEAKLAPLLELARRKTQAHGQRLIWYTPTQYCNFDPQQLELGVKGCTAALYNMCIEPDGNVLPCQSYYRPLGNILTDPWEAIWEHSLARRIREREYIPQKCTTCGLRPECGGGCPLTLEAPSPALIPIDAIH